MRSAFARSLCCIAPLAALLSASGSGAAILINFESDTALINLLNNFESNDSSEVHFSDTDGLGLIVLEAGGNKALGVLPDDDSGLLMEFDFVASALSIDIGNTSLANFGDTAVLTVFSGGIEVGNTVLALNLTDAIDQTISYSGGAFDSAILRYEVAGGLTELVDNIRVTAATAVRAVPEPSSVALFGIGAVLVGAICGRSSLADGQPRRKHD